MPSWIRGLHQLQVVAYDRCMSAVNEVYGAVVGGTLKYAMKCVMKDTLPHKTVHLQQYSAVLLWRDRVGLV